jgi:hypothetical protein
MNRRDAMSAARRSRNGMEDRQNHGDPKQNQGCLTTKGGVVRIFS